MYLQEDINDASAFLCLFVNLFQQFKRIDCLYHGDIRSDILDFVGLQMTYEMPLDILRECLHLLAKFLFVALTEDALTFVISRLYILVRMILTNSHKADTLWQISKYVSQMTLNVVIHHYSTSGLSFFPYSKTSMSVVSDTLAMT